MENQAKKKRIQLSLDKQTLEMLGKIAEENAYDSVSSAIRIMVKKYGKYELQSNIQKSESASL